MNIELEFLMDSSHSRIISNIMINCQVTRANINEPSTQRAN